MKTLTKLQLQRITISEIAEKWSYRKSNPQVSNKYRTAKPQPQPNLMNPIKIPNQEQITNNIPES